MLAFRFVEKCQLRFRYACFRIQVTDYFLPQVCIDFCLFFAYYFCLSRPPGAELEDFEHLSLVESDLQASYEFLYNHALKLGYSEPKLQQVSLLSSLPSHIFIIMMSGCPTTWWTASSFNWPIESGTVGQGSC